MSGRLHVRGLVFSWMGLTGVLRPHPRPGAAPHPRGTCLRCTGLADHPSLEVLSFDNNGPRVDGAFPSVYFSSTKALAARLRRLYVHKWVLLALVLQMWRA